MRAKYVKESINFERGKDPMISIGLGIREALADGFIRLYNDFPGSVGYTNSAGSVGLSISKEAAPDKSESDAYAIFTKYIPEDVIKSLKKDWRGSWEVWLKPQYKEEIRYAFKKRWEEYESKSSK
jgi:hypothetical protein